MNPLVTRKLVVAFPAEMEFSEAETSVLCKGLSFVPVSKNTGEFQVKAGCENFYRRLRLKAHFLCR